MTDLFIAATMKAARKRLLRGKEEVGLDLSGQVDSQGLIARSETRQATPRTTTFRAQCAVLLFALFASELAVLPARAQPVDAQSTHPGQDTTSLNGIVPGDLDTYPDVRAYVEQGRFGQALSALQAKQSRHNDDPAYFNLLGIIALKAADYATAITAFERVVLMQPDNAGAWLDLAIASAELGNSTSAAAYFDYVESQFNPPPAVRVVISRYRARMAARQDASPWQVYVDAMAGADTNANSGVRTSAIPLTFGAERIDLLLDPSFRARSDRFLYAGVGARYRQRLGNNVAEIVMEARTREYAHEKDSSTIGANLSAGLHRATIVGDASAWLHVERLWLGGRSLLNNLRAIVQLEHPRDGCRLGLGTELEWRRYTSLNNLDANVAWGQLGVACDWRLAQMPVQSILIGRTGLDDPIGSRPGGQARHNELIAQFGMPLAWGARADLSITLAQTRDAEGYSPLLEQNAARHLDRHTLRLTVVAPVAPDIDFHLLAEDNRFKSNLALFNQSGKSLSVGFRYRF